MSLRVLSSGFVVLGIALLMVSPALAQRRGPMPMQDIKSGGTLVSVGPNQIQISTNTNQMIYVMFGPSTQLSVKGTAEQEYLKAGVVVEFEADVDKAHAVKDKITDLTIITPTTDRPLGLSAAEGAGENAKPLAPDPGDAPAKGRKKKDADSQGGDSKSSKSGVLKPPGRFTVRGTIKMCKDGKISVSAGRSGPTIKAELASDAKIYVDMADLHAAQRDDRVTVKGKTSQARPNFILAESIQVDLANPLSGPKKKATRPAKASAAPAAKAKKGAADADDLLGGGK